MPIERLNEERDRLVDLIVRSEKAIEESRKIIARIDRMVESVTKK